MPTALASACCLQTTVGRRSSGENDGARRFFQVSRDIARRGTLSATLLGERAPMICRPTGGRPLFEQREQLIIALERRPYSFARSKQQVVSPLLQECARRVSLIQCHFNMTEMPNRCLATWRGAALSVHVKDAPLYWLVESFGNFFDVLVRKQDPLFGILE